MKKRTNKTKEEFAELIHKYFTECSHMKRQAFCEQESISSTAFYRHLKLYKINQNIKISKKETKGEFIEIKSDKPISKQNVLIKLFGYKLFSVELQYV